MTVDYATADGTATTAGQDYLATSGTLTFAPGETTKTITVEVIGDHHDRAISSRSVVNLGDASPNALVIDGYGLGGINDDDMPWPPPPG